MSCKDNGAFDDGGFGQGIPMDAGIDMLTGILEALALPFKGDASRYNLAHPEILDCTLIGAASGRSVTGWIFS